MRVLAARWHALAPKQRVLAGLLTAAALVAIAFAAMLQRDTRVAVFAAPLRSEQVAEVVERLAQWNVAFIALPDNVRVEASRRNDVLLKLSLAGVPHAHLASSAESLAKAGPLTPQSVLEAQQREGLAGDLAAGLRGVSGVADAQVIIAPAREGAFVDDPSHEATASVRLGLRPGAVLGRDALDGIRQFVASGVPGLDPKRVAILDDRGIAAADHPSSASGEAQNLEQSLQSVLDLAVGADATIVRVRVNYDSRVRESHDVVRRPLGSRAIATSTNDERYKSASKQYTKSIASLERGSEIHDERIDTPAGRLERISVAVAVDRARTHDLATIRSLAKGTLGLISSRGDSLSVEAIAFPHAAALAPREPYAAALGYLALLAPTAIVAFAIVVSISFSAKPLGLACEALAHRHAVRRQTQTVASFAPSHVRGALAGEPPHTAAAIISALPAATATAVLDMYSTEERAAIVRRMSRAAAPVVPDYETVLRRG